MPDPTTSTVTGHMLGPKDRSRCIDALFERLIRIPEILKCHVLRLVDDQEPDAPGPIIISQLCAGALADMPLQRFLKHQPNPGAANPERILGGHQERILNFDFLVEDS